MLISIQEEERCLELPRRVASQKQLEANKQSLICSEMKWTLAGDGFPECLVLPERRGQTSELLMEQPTIFF